MITTLAIFIPRMTALRPFYDLITNFSRFPGQLFTQGNLLYEVLLVPIFLISTIPVQLMLKKSPIYYFGFEIVGTIALTVIGLKFWNFAIKQYSSASS